MRKVESEGGVGGVGGERLGHGETSQKPSELMDTQWVSLTKLELKVKYVAEERVGVAGTITLEVLDRYSRDVMPPD
jgi:hypothetical protein